MSQLTPAVLNVIQILNWINSQLVSHWATTRCPPEDSGAALPKPSCMLLVILFSWFWLTKNQPITVRFWPSVNSCSIPTDWSFPMGSLWKIRSVNSTESINGLVWMQSNVQRVFHKKISFSTRHQPAIIIFPILWRSPSIKCIWFLKNFWSRACDTQSQ